VFFILLSSPAFAEVLEEREFKVDKTSISIKKISCKASGSRSIIKISGLIGPDRVRLSTTRLRDWRELFFNE